jgi:hypothetical protein
VNLDPDISPVGQANVSPSRRARRFERFIHDAPSQTSVVGAPAFAADQFLVQLFFIRVRVAIRTIRNRGQEQKGSRMLSKIVFKKRSDRCSRASLRLRQDMSRTMQTRLLSSSMVTDASWT